MIKHLILTLGAWMAAPCSHAAFATLDDFSGDLSKWTSTVILNNGRPAFNTSKLTITSGVLNYVTDGYDGIEQAAHIFPGWSLSVGEELRVSVSATSQGTQDIGLYVGAPPTSDITIGGFARASFVTVYRRSTDKKIYSRGFYGTTEYDLAWTTRAVTEDVVLFIKRVDKETYELGYYTANSARVLIATRKDASNPGTAVGLYTDVRGNGTLGGIDNFCVFDISTNTP